MGSELSAGMKVAASDVPPRALWGSHFLPLPWVHAIHGGRRRAKDTEEVRGRGQRRGALSPGWTSGTRGYLGTEPALCTCTLDSCTAPHTSNASTFGLMPCCHCLEIHNSF